MRTMLSERRESKSLLSRAENADGRIDAVVVVFCSSAAFPLQKLKNSSPRRQRHGPRHGRASRGRGADDGLARLDDGAGVERLELDADGLRGRRAGGGDGRGSHGASRDCWPRRSGGRSLREGDDGGHIAFLFRKAVERERETGGKQAVGCLGEKLKWESLWFFVFCRRKKKKSTLTSTSPTQVDNSLSLLLRILHVTKKEEIIN